MKNKVVVIIGSSRNDGDTKRLVTELIHESNFETINLNYYNFWYQEYEDQN